MGPSLRVCDLAYCQLRQRWWEFLSVVERGRHLGHQGAVQRTYGDRFTQKSNSQCGSSKVGSLTPMASCLKTQPPTSGRRVAEAYRQPNKGPSLPSAENEREETSGRLRSSLPFCALQATGPLHCPKCLRPSSLFIDPLSSHLRRRGVQPKSNCRANGSKGSSPPDVPRRPNKGSDCCVERVEPPQTLLGIHVPDLGP